MSRAHGYVSHVVAVRGGKAACVRLVMADDEDVSDAPTAPFGAGPMSYGAWYAEPIREDGWMWDALTAHGAGGAA